MGFGATALISRNAEDLEEQRARGGHERAQHEGRRNIMKDETLPDSPSMTRGSWRSPAGTGEPVRIPKVTVDPGRWRLDLLRICVVLALAATLGGVSEGATTSRLVGTVVSQDGKPLAGVAVSLMSDVLIGGGREEESDTEGRFLFSLLPPGRYLLQARGEAEPLSPYSCHYCGLCQAACPQDLPATPKTQRIQQELFSLFCPSRSQ